MREDGHAVDDALYSLAMGPDTRVRHSESCVVGDVRYNTLARDEDRKTQNSAIMSTDTYDKEITEMYANITDIVQLPYISSFEDHGVWFCCAVVGITCFPGSQNPELMIISYPSMSRWRTRPTSLLFWQIKQHRYFSWKTPDVQDNTDVPNIFENHHVNDAGKKIACHAVDIQELIKKKPTFKDEEEDDTMGNSD